MDLRYTKPIDAVDIMRLEIFPYGDPIPEIYGLITGRHDADSMNILDLIIESAPNIYHHNFSNQHGSVIFTSSIRKLSALYYMINEHTCINLVNLVHLTLYDQHKEPIILNGGYAFANTLRTLIMYIRWPTFYDNKITLSDLTALETVEIHHNFTKPIEVVLGDNMNPTLTVSCTVCEE